MKALVVGGGPAGLLSAILLAARGYHVQVYERRAPPSPEELAHGPKTIVFAISGRGRKALLRAGVRLPTEQDPVDIKGFNQAPKAALHMRNAAGEAKTTYIPLISGPTVFVERAALVNHLRSETQRLHEDRIKLIDSMKLLSTDFEQQTAAFTHSDTEQTVTAAYDLLIATDGRYSKVRQLLQEADPSFQCNIVFAKNSYQAFNKLPPAGSFTLDANRDTGVHFFREPTGGFRLAVWPTSFGTFSGLTDARSEWFGGSRRDAGHRKTAGEYEAHLRKRFPSIPNEWFANIAQQLESSPLSKNGATVTCSKLHGPATVLLGDAAHAVTPAMGQGCNCALESALIFDEVLRSSGDDVPTAVAAFTRRRLPEAHALAQWDLDSEYRLGQMGKLRLAFLGTRFHVLLWMGMSKAFRIKGPLYLQMLRGEASFSQAWRAMQRDRILFAVLAGATAMMLVLGLARLAGY